MLQDFINQFKRCQANGEAIRIKLDSAHAFPTPGKDGKTILVRGYYHCVVYNQKCSFGNCPVLKDGDNQADFIDNLMKTIGIKP